MDLASEFQADHQRILDALLAVRGVICEGTPSRLHAILDRADRLLGPHCKWEEVFLYPALAALVGEVAVQRLITEHDGVHRSLQRLAELARVPRWSDAERRAAHEHWGILIEHLTNCDALSRYIPLLGPDMLRQLGEGLWAIRRQGITLSGYCRERRVG
jgi:hypothetical protein